jgi:hypothetical protein
MALSPVYVPQLTPAGWFDPTATPGGWFDETTATTGASNLKSGVVDVTSTTTRVNLVPNPSFGSSLTGWSGANLYERITSEPYHLYGSAALVAYTLPAGSDTNMAYTTTTTTTQTGNHVISAWLYTGAGNALIGKTVAITVEGGTATVTPGASTAATLTADTWVLVSLVINVTGNGTVLFVLRLNVAPSTVTAYSPLVIDGVMMEAGSELLPFFDGDVAVGITPTAQSWSGTPENSSSSITFHNSGYVQLSTSAMPAPIPRSQAATDVTVAPTVAAVPTAMVKTQTATGTTVAPASLASGTVTRFGVATATAVTRTTTASLGAVSKTTSAVDCDITPFSGTDLATNTSAEVDLTDWVPYYNSTLTRVSTDAHDGSWSVLNTNTSTTRYGTQFNFTSLPAGRQYRFTFWWKYLSGTNTDWRATSWYSGLSLTLGPATGQWQYDEYVWDSGPVPANNYTAFNHNGNATIGSTFLIDDVHLYDITRTITTHADGFVTQAADADPVLIFSPGLGITPAAVGAISSSRTAGYTLSTLSSDLAPNGNFETNVVGWSAKNGYGTQVYWDNTQSHLGSASLRTNAAQAFTGSSFGFDFTASAAETRLIGSVWVKRNIGSGLFRALVTDGSNTYLGDWMTPDGTWQQYTWDITTTGSTLTAMTFAFQDSDSASNSSVWIDDCQLYEVGAMSVAASGVADRTQSATGVTITPASAAAGDTTVGANTQYGDATSSTAPTVSAAGVTDHRADAAVTITPTTAAVPDALTKTQTATGVTASPAAVAAGGLAQSVGATGVTVTPTALAAPGATSKSATASVVVTPITDVVPLPITDQSTADVTTTPTVAAAGTTTHLATADITVSPTPAAVPLPITDTATADVTTSPATAAAAGATAKSATAADTITPTVTSVPSAMAKTSDAALAITPASTAAAGASTKSATAADTPVAPVSTASLGAKTISGATALTITPTTAAAGVSVGSGSGTAFLTITPSTTADAAGIPRTQSATGTSVSPTTAAAGTVIKAIDAPGLTITPVSAASATVTHLATATQTSVSPTTDTVPTPITDTAFVTITVSPSATAAAAPIVDTAGANITVSPATAATPAAMVKAASASVTTVSPTTGAVVGGSGFGSLTISPVSAASGSVERMGTASVTVTPIPSTVVPLREAMAVVAFVASVITNANTTKTAFGQASALVTALSDANAIYQAFGHADTTISPIPLAKCGADWTSTAELVIAAVTAANARTRRPERWGTLRI